MVSGFGDFSTRANETDMLMRNSNTGAFEVYDIVNNTITSFAPMGQVGLEWTIAGFGDFSGNANETDMLMRNSNTGVFELYDSWRAASCCPRGAATLGCGAGRQRQATSPARGTGGRHDGVPANADDRQRVIRLGAYAYTARHHETPAATTAA